MAWSSLLSQQMTQPITLCPALGPPGWAQPDQKDPGPGPDGYYSTALWLLSHRFLQSYFAGCPAPHMAWLFGKHLDWMFVWVLHSVGGMSRNAKFVSTTLP